MESKMIKRKRKGSRTFLTLSKKCKRYRSGKLPCTSPSSTQSEESSIDDCELKRTTSEFCAKETQTFQPKKYNCGIQCSPPPPPKLTTSSHTMTDFCKKKPINSIQHLPRFHRETIEK